MGQLAEVVVGQNCAACSLASALCSVFRAHWVKFSRAVPREIVPRQRMRCTQGNRTTEHSSSTVQFAVYNWTAEL